MDTVQIWKCECGAKRVWGNAGSPDGQQWALLLCAKACSRKHTPHVFVKTQHQKWNGETFVAVAVN